MTSAAENPDPMINSGACRGCVGEGGGNFNRGNNNGLGGIRSVKTPDARISLLQVMLCDPIKKPFLVRTTPPISWPHRIDSDIPTNVAYAARYSATACLDGRVKGGKGQPWTC